MHVSREDMVEWFDARTTMHITLVQNYLREVLRLGLPEIDIPLFMKEFNHDASKWESPEYEPYLHISWRYKQSMLGKKYILSPELEEQAALATLHHVKNNPHHPEYWDSSVTFQHLNMKNRDEPGDLMVDATRMPLTYIAGMIADWLAMSEERKTDIYEWFTENINVRWKFTSEQASFMKTLTDRILSK